MIREIFIIVVSESENNNWGEPTLLSGNNNVAYSDCKSWANAADSGIKGECCFALINRTWSSKLRNNKIRELMNYAEKEGQEVLLFWHNDNLKVIMSALDNLQCNNMAHEPLTFHHDDNYPALKALMEAVAELNNRGSEAQSTCHKKFNKLVKSYLAKADLELVTELLPIDIDMQMLKELKEEEAKEYLQRMIDETSNYKERFKRIQELKSNVKNDKVQSCLDALIGKADKSSPLHEFLVSLDNLRSKADFTNEDVKKAVDSSKCLRETFHQWYCDMTSCLKGRKMCSD